jgi:ADP-heptose:LPS heptosyltransferase
LRRVANGMLASMADREATAPRQLIIFPGALGDLLCAAPAMRFLMTQQPPGVNAELMARAELARFAIGRMGFVHGHSIDRREVGQLFAGGAGFAPEASAFFSRFDDIRSFFASNDPAFTAALSAATEHRAHFYPFRPNGAGHIARLYLDAVGAPPDVSSAFRLELYPEDLAAADERLAAAGLAPGDYVAIFPGSGGVEKNWPIANFVALARQLAPPLKPLVILGPAENRLGPVFDAPGLTVLSGLELAEVAAIAHQAAAFVGNDSGTSHLAASAGATGVAIFGPTDPARWRPQGRVAIIHRMPLAMTTVVEVMDKLFDMIKRNGSKRLADD